MLSCDELLWQIYTEKEILSLVTVSEEDDIHGRETAKANLIQLYNYARSFAGSSFRGVYDFLSFITDVVENKTKIKLSGASKTQDSVKIISAHKSKGLEFPVCFVCACGSDFNLKDSEKDIIFDKNMGILPRISAKSGDGIDTLSARIEELYSGGKIDYDTAAVLVNARQNASVTKASECIARALEQLRGGFESDTIGFELEEALCELGELDGRRVSEEIVDGIFHHFCVGK